MPEHAADDLGTKLAARARSLANLRPPWTKGNAPRSSGRPVGIIQDELERYLQVRSKGGRGLTWSERIVRRWVHDAAKGNGYARQQILDRKYPIPKDLEGDGRVVLQALTLQLGGTSQQVFQASHGAQLPSFASGSESESHGGGRAGRLSGVSESEGSAEPERAEGVSGSLVSGTPETPACVPEEKASESPE